MKRLALVAMAAAASMVGPAFAADLPSRYAPTAPYYVPPPIFTFNGLYAGINGQVGFGGISTTGGAAGFGGPFGGLGGATIGYNYQSGTLLVGLEADIGFGSISSPSSSGPINSGAAIHGLGTGRARLGYVMDRALLYVTGGYAGASMNGSVSDFSRAPGYVLQESHYLNGFAVGAGVEYALTTRISIKGEYLYTDFGSQGFFNGSRDALTASAHVNLVRAGLNYHF